MQKTLPTKKFSLVIAVTALLLLPQEAFSNPGSYGMQMCSMMRGGTSQKRPWDYIIEQHTMRTEGQMGGFGIAAGIVAGQQLRGMRSDVFAVARANCPEAFGGEIYRSNTSTPKAYSNATKNDIEVFNSDYCAKNPWERKCNFGNPVMNAGRERNNARSSCLKAIEKYDCRYTKYLEANPHMQDWADSNPEMAWKEALRLKAIDANEIGSGKTEKPVFSAAERAAKSLSPRPENTDCLTASDYKGCMEYHKSN